MKAMTPEERIASVDPNVAFEIIEKNSLGRGMKHLAADYRISEETVRAIIRDAKITDRPQRTKMPDPSVRADLWTRPELWKRYGIKGPCTPRMVPAI